MSRYQAPKVCTAPRRAVAGLPRLVLLGLMVAGCGPREAAAQSAQGRPFRTLSPMPLPSGMQSLDVGAEFRSSANPEPLLGHAEGDLLRIPELRYRIGFGRA